MWEWNRLSKRYCDKALTTIMMIDYSVKKIGKFACISRIFLCQQILAKIGRPFSQADSFLMFAYFWTSTCVLSGK